MSIPRRFNLLIAIIILIKLSRRAAQGITVEKVVVPPVVIAGKSVELQCLYKEEGHELYSLKWWKGEDQFYQYIPPKRSFYSIPGIRVNMATMTDVNMLSPPGLERVILDAVDLETAGVFKCEVMADKIFQTVFKEANMTVVVPPAGPPIISGISSEHQSVQNGQRISLLCSVPQAHPPPTVTWKVNNRDVKNLDWVTDHPTMYSGGPPRVVSTLDFVVTQEILDDTLDSLEIECETRQPKSSYLQKDTVKLYPKRTSYFWLFSRGSLPQPLPAVVLAFILISRIL